VRIDVIRFTQIAWTLLYFSLPSETAPPSGSQPAIRRHISNRTTNAHRPPVPPEPLRDFYRPWSGLVKIPSSGYSRRLWLCDRGLRRGGWSRVFMRVSPAVKEA
jgi:hypothetical protein